MVHAKQFLKKCLFVPLIIAILAMLLTTGCSSLTGPQGEPGISIRWIGSMATAPGSPQLNDAYYNTANAKSYIWDGDSWEILAQDGISLEDLETAIADNIADLQEQITELEAKVTDLEQSLGIVITNAAISWGTDPDRVIFTWTVTNLNPSYEYWVYPHVGFLENSGPFGSTPEDEASNLQGMYEMAINNYRPAEDGTGAWNWFGGKPSVPTGKLALLAYNPATHKAYVVDISEPIDTSGW